MLHITDITYRIGDRLLIDQATVVVPAGHKVGLVGPNGAGKSTLLKMILGELSPETGEVKVRPSARLGHVGQEAPGGPQSLLDTVIQSNKELVSLEAEALTATDPHRIAEIHTRLADISAHTANARAATILKGLGFDEEAQARPCSSYSGGWRMRVALACVLFNEPDLLLLDEPTNYLDLEGVIWLETFLKSYPYTVLIVSHDRDLLNNAVGHIVHLEGGKLNIYTGGYDRFEQLRAEKMERQAALKSKQEAERRHIQAFVDRFKAKASKAKQAQSRLKLLEKMQPIATMATSETIPFRFPNPEPLSSPLIALEGASVGYEVDHPILKKLDLRVDMDDRIALLGANGNGKSTFAKLLSGRLAPMDGTCRKSKVLKVGYFAQHQLDELNPKSTPLDQMKKLMPDAIESKVRARLGSFGFGADKADRSIESLSGGEKARLMFAVCTFDAPQLLILDEPTNHLDVDSREALIHAINDFDGAVVLISHDRHLLEACADRLWLVEKGDVKRFEGDLADYRIHLLKERGGDRADKTDKSDSSRKAQRQAAADIRLKLAPLRREAERAEAKVEKLSALVANLEEKLGNPALYASQDAAATAKVTALQVDLAKQKALLEDAEMAWLEAQEAYDSAVEAAG
ncbi:ABC-F family ATP-binding cassette domain-containing protein [Gimibacter soli]|uniref:ABC-F family ATP-binding cassette domain-containing protein n=1 Tax=Gimibacter soli TaxID=3024400 RepID=A0AAE9XRU7_9PROT|nr:ABC-F family ATP-binding cassette domain-containing protein [Gimibacter soli]WCL52805.1 ABC-F family ATP-binding cassette domain-containing protein [Gimibacter soli]